MCVCVYEREREREKEGGKKREIERESEIANTNRSIKLINPLTFDTNLNHNKVKVQMSN
jgi:hypothetical protein